MATKRTKRNLNKGRTPKGMDVTEAILASYGNKRQKIVKEAVKKK